MNFFGRASIGIELMILEATHFPFSFCKPQSWISPAGRVPIFNWSYQRRLSSSCRVSKVGHEFLFPTKYDYWMNGTGNHYLSALISQSSFMNSLTRPSSGIEWIIPEISVLFLSFLETHSWISSPDPVPVFNRSYRKSLASYFHFS